MSPQPLSPRRPAWAKSLHLDVSRELGVKAPTCCTNTVPSWGAFLVKTRFFETEALKKRLQSWSLTAIPSTTGVAWGPSLWREF